MVPRFFLEMLCHHKKNNFFFLFFVSVSFSLTMKPVKKIYPELKKPITIYGHDDDDDGSVEEVKVDEDEGDDGDGIPELEGSQHEKSEEKNELPEVIYREGQHLEFEIPFRPKDYYDDSDESDLGENKEEKKSKFKSQKVIVSNLQQQRQEMKDKIVKEVLDAVLPDIDAYDIDGTSHDRKDAYNKYYNRLLQWMKFLGCLELDLHDAVLTGSIAQVRKSLHKLTQGKDANPELINEYDQKGCTALSYAVKIKAIEIVQLLLEYDALTDFVDMKTGRTPLFYSVINGSVDISRVLLNAGSSSNAVDVQCVSPLMLAAFRNDVPHCQLLCKYLADVDIQDENGWTALHYAAFGNAPEVINYLLGEGADRNVRDMNKKKPMHLAKFKKHGNCIASLSTKSKIGM
jgi:hypothetical protein